MRIKSESQIILKLLFSILKLPFIFLLFLFGKRKLSDLTKPIDILSDFVWETRFTSNIILINIVVYLSTIILKGLGILSDTFISTYLLNRPTDILQFNIIQIVASWFMHASFSHLFGNMIFLFILGRVVEKTIGAKKTALIYFGSAIISTLFNSLINLLIIKTNTPGLGASGAIAGLASAAMLLNPFYLTYLVMGIPIPIIFVSWTFLFSDLMGIIHRTNDGIGHFAHLGGFLAITLLYTFLDKKDIKVLKKGLTINIITFIIYIFLILII